MCAVEDLFFSDAMIMDFDKAKQMIPSYILRDIVQIVQIPFFFFWFFVT